MSYVLFLDDVREPGEELGECAVARNVRQAKQIMLEHGVPHTLSLDHDLGEGEPTAMKFLWWLIHRDLDDEISLTYVKTVIIHSANPVGAQNLKLLWDGFAENELKSDVRAILKPRTT